jgi:hypothetical protein
MRNGKFAYITYNWGDVFCSSCALVVTKSFMSVAILRYFSFLCISCLFTTIFGNILQATYQTMVYLELTLFQQELKIVVPKLLDHKFCFERRVIDPFSILWITLKSHQTLKIIHKTMNISATLIFLGMVGIPEL